MIRSPSSSTAGSPTQNPPSQPPTVHDSGATSHSAQSSNENARKMFITSRSRALKSALVVEGTERIGHNNLPSSFPDYVASCLEDTRTKFVENILKTTKEAFIEKATEENLQSLVALY